MRIIFNSLGLYLLLFCGAGCLFVPGNLEYQGPEKRPAELTDYYSVKNSFWGFEQSITNQEDDYEVLEITLLTDSGPITIDYYRQYEKTKELILVFPILGGSNLFAKYFATFFVENGIDAAMVHRSSAFKDPENVERLEELFRENIIRDRVALDFFEEIFGKETFGAFGLSRGAINVAMTAGVDPRLQFNVMVMGGSDLVGIFKDSTQGGLEKYRKRAAKKMGMSEDELFEWLEGRIATDPKNVAQYIDADNTLLFIALFDSTVPRRYGLQLRKQLGRPDTIFLLSDHYTSLLFTQFVPIFPPDRKFGIFPFDYVEREALEFFKNHFGQEFVDFRLLPIRFLQLPFRVSLTMLDYFF